MKQQPDHHLLVRSADPTVTPPVKGWIQELEEGIGLCLSGGGYRAMLFHVGSLWRLLELGYLARLDRISGVSGGSITAAVLGLNWRILFQENWSRQAFQQAVVAPLRRLASKTIDVKAVLLGAFLPGTINNHLARIYRRELFGNATLQDLPDKPRFTLNATNVGSAVLWRFAKPYMRDYRVGEVQAPKVPLALAVAASSAFPPVLSPAILELNPQAFTPGSGEDLQGAPYTSRAVLSDGGVYDNLGLEPVWKRYRTILVSDAGARIKPEPRPAMNWLSHIIRVVNVIDSQVRSLRKRQLLAAYQAQLRSGTYWGIGTNISDYGLQDALSCPFPDTLALAQVSTRLAAMEATLQERLINWGYAVCDAAMRRWVDPTAQKPSGFPYPAAGVG
jgi:NTE family protein